MRMMRRSLGGMVLCAAVVCVICSAASATPSFVYHDPGVQVYDQPAGVTMREPEVPREEETVQLYIKIGPSFTYDSVAIYYTDDGSTPQGSKGIPQGSTMVLLSYGPAPEVTFMYNEPGGSGNDDWWQATAPYFTRDYQERIRYKIGAWESGGFEVFADGGTVYEYTNKLAWPGAGAGQPDPAAGYPPVSFWKEEGVVGNNYMNVMIDENGTVYDVYYPSAGCVNGIGTKNEGYVDGLDTFPAGLPLGSRGQMHMNQAMAGIRVGGTTYWLSNESGVGYENVAQQYVSDTNVISTYAKLIGKDITIQQYDYCPKDITYPVDDGANPNRGIYVKRYILSNTGATDEEFNFYYYADFALNGGDDYDGMFTDSGRGAMVAYDRTARNTSSSGEYNPTTFSDYTKSVSVYLGVSMRVCDSVGSGSSTAAGDFWSDTSSDQDRGWVGVKVDLPAGTSKEIDVAYVGGFDGFADATGTYDYQMDNAIDWFLATSQSAVQSATESYWTTWLADGTTVDFPDDRFDDTFRRSLLATALHLDGKNGGIIAGMHNGAYPFVWPRDAAWAAITLARAGHVWEAQEIYRFLRDVAYRDVEGWGSEGFWKQKYSTDGYTVWGTPQVDETSCYPWGIKYIFDMTGDVSFLEGHYVEVYEAAIASSQDSTVDGRLYVEPFSGLIHSMSLWEDAFDVFNYSNASVIRGLEDAAGIANILDQYSCPGGPGTCNYHNDVSLYTSRANGLRSALDARLAWNGENTDISQLGITYPFEVYPVGHARTELIMDRINGVANDTFGNNQPLVNYSGEWEGLINRYWGDTYWNNTYGPNPDGSPWFLTTMWYGCYYAMRQDINPDKGDIDNHRYRMELLLDRVGNLGLGAEQIAPLNSLLIPGQSDFVLQTAWPNAWESMSFFVDAIMVFLDLSPDALGNVLKMEPKLPTGWPSMAFSNVRLGDHRVDVLCEEAGNCNSHTITNNTGVALGYDTVVRVPAGTTILAVAENGVAHAYTYDSVTGRVEVTGSLATGSGAVTVISVYYGQRGDTNGDGGVDVADYEGFADCLAGPGVLVAPACAVADIDVDGDVDLADYAAFQALFGP